MPAALQTDVLVLNKNWLAITVIEAAEAISDLFTGKVVAVDDDYQQYDFDSWAGLSHYRSTFESKDHSFIKAVKYDILVPSVVRLLKFEKAKKSRIRLSRRNIYKRDQYTCQYTGKKLPAHKINLDHVLPSSRGGKTTWENVVCCSIDVNTMKGNKTPEEAGLSLIRKPREPLPGELTIKRQKMPRSWKSFVDTAYWNTELED